MAKPEVVEPYPIRIYGKGIEITNAIQNYILEKIHKMERLTENIIDIIIRIEVQRLDHSVHITIKYTHFKIYVHADTLELYSAIDKAFERLDHKMRKWKGRIQNHQAKKTAVIDMKVNVFQAPVDEVEMINQEIEAANQKNLEKIFHIPKEVKTKMRPLKMLTLAEAIMKMELSGDHFLIYKSEEDQILKVIYRRRDGSYGVIIPEEK